VDLHPETVGNVELKPLAVAELFHVGVTGSGLGRVEVGVGVLRGGVSVCGGKYNRLKSRTDGSVGREVRMRKGFVAFLARLAQVGRQMG
jgi:hypothetical protein